MQKNSNQNKGIKFGRDAEDPKIKGMDQIWVQCQRTRNKRMGSNLGAMLENTKQNRKGLNLGMMPENPY